jgi:hypothetical protein
MTREEALALLGDRHEEGTLKAKGNHRSLVDVLRHGANQIDAVMKR